MNKQINLSALTDEPTQVRTKKKEFLEQINRIIPLESGLHSFGRVITKENTEISPMGWNLCYASI